MRKCVIAPQWEEGGRGACWDLPCSSCSCQWQTWWRVADVLLCADGVELPSHLRELTAFIHLSVAHCFVCQSAESAHTQSLFERVNNECVRPSAAAFNHTGSLLTCLSLSSETTHLSAPSVASHHITLLLLLFKQRETWWFTQVSHITAETLWIHPSVFHSGSDWNISTSAGYVAGETRILTDMSFMKPMHVCFTPHPVIFHVHTLCW